MVPQVHGNKKLKYMKIKIWMYSLSVVLYINSCTQKKPDMINKGALSRECILLNDSAFKHITKYNQNEDSRHLDTALYLLKEAISCDSNYFIAYSNMANTYDFKKDYKAEITILNKMLIIDNNSWWILVRKGMTYEKLNNLDSTKQAYFLADSLVKVDLKKNPSNKGTIISYIMLINAIYGKEAAVKELNKQIKKHPEFRPELINGTKL